MGRSKHSNKLNYKLHHPSHLYISAGLFTLLVYGYLVQPIYCKCYVWKNNNFNMFVQSLVSLEAADVLFHRKNVQNIKQWSEAWMRGGKSPYMKSCKGHGPKIKCRYHVWLYWDEWRTDNHVDSSNAWGGRCNESGKRKAPGYLTREFSDTSLPNGQNSGCIVGVVYQWSVIVRTEL